MDWTIGLMVINKDSYYDGAYLKVRSLVTLYTKLKR